MRITQKIFGWFNNQTIVNNNLVVNEQYLSMLLSLPNNPSDINHIVLSLYNSIADDTTVTNKRSVPPEIEEKINYNNVLVYKPLIESNFSENGFFLDEAYNALDYETPGRRKLFLSYINTQYLLVLGQIMNEKDIKEKMLAIESNADTIITKIIDILLIRISKNSSLIEHLSQESITNCVISIVCHAFVDCKVLENPNSQ